MITEPQRFLFFTVIMCQVWNAFSSYLLSAATNLPQKVSIRSTL